MKKYTTQLLLILATLFWGANFVLAKIALTHLPPSFVAAGRFTAASIILLVLVFLNRKDIDWKLVQKKIPLLILSGTIGVFIFNFMMFVGLQTTSSTNGALIMGLNPLLTLIFSSLLLKTKITRWQFVGIVISFSGVVCIISKGDLSVLRHMNFAIGDLLLVISSAAFGLYNVFNRKYLSSFDSTTLTAFTTLPATLLFILLASFEASANLSAVPLTAYISIVFMGIFGSVLAYFFWNNGVKNLGANRTAIFINLVPAFATLFSVLSGQALNFTQIAGGSLIIVGVVLCNSLKK